MTLATLALVALIQGAALSAGMALAWAIQQRTGNSGWVDAVWTFALGTVGALSAFAPLSDSWPTNRQVIVALLVSLWSLRLGLHIVRRSARRPDDPRYGSLIRGWGADAPRQMLILLQKQALVSIPLALSIFVAAHNPYPELRIQDILASLLLLLAIGGEAVADRQLTDFTSDPANRGRICDRGLWGLSRHPNYFFEWLQWVAYPLLAIDLTGSYPWGWIAIAGPFCMYWLLTRVSGIPPLEEHMLRRYGAAYREYQNRTNAFFPARPLMRARIIDP